MSSLGHLCDICGAPATHLDPNWDGLDYCDQHHRECRLADLRQERDRLKDWLESTHLARLRELEAEIVALEATSPDAP